MHELDLKHFIDTKQWVPRKYLLGPNHNPNPAVRDYTKVTGDEFVPVAVDQEIFWTRAIFLKENHTKEYPDKVKIFDSAEIRYTDKRYYLKNIKQNVLVRMTF
jgi:hypothetical protein